MTDDNVKNEIQNMSIDNVESILINKYNITQVKLQTYPEDIKRDLLFDLETHIITGN